MVFLKGDSGGGLICDNDLSGIVSFGNGCAIAFFPGVYTDVSAYNEWIDKVVNNDLISITTTETTTTTKATNQQVDVDDYDDGASINVISLYILIGSTVTILFFN